MNLARASKGIGRTPEFPTNGVSVAKKRKVGRPANEVSEEMALRARELFGRYPIRSKVATFIAREFQCGRPTAYKAIGVALEAFKDELAGRGEVDALLVAYASLTCVLSSDMARDRDRVAAATALIKLLGVKAFRELAGADEIADFMAEVTARRLARASENPKPPEPPA